MGLSEKDIERLGPAARAQIKAKLEHQEKRRETVRPKSADDFESDLERDYYLAEIQPKIYAGLVDTVEMHKSFELLPKSEYCGIRLHDATYTPDFVITYTNGFVEVVEVKNKKIRRLQGSYVYRRRLFIELYARPNGWKFTEYIV